MDVAGSTTVAKVKDKVHEQEGIHPAHQRLIYNFKVLEVNRTLSSYKILRDAVRGPWHGRKYSKLFLVPREPVIG